MIKLSKEEMDYVISLSMEYKKIHSDIKDIENLMKEFSEKAKVLINDLESKRNEEKKFLLGLEDKYGEGHIDVFSLSWKSKKIEQESEN